MWEIHQHMKTSKERDKKLLGLIKNIDWGSVWVLAPNEDDMTLEFHRILDELMNQCYEWKKVRH